jgi:putative aldouronate transport system permease protein
MVGRSKEDRRFDIINVTLVVLVTFLILYPLIFVVSASISHPDYVNTGKVYLWPREVSFGGYTDVLREDRVWMGYRNTIFYVAVDIAVSVTVIILAGYALSRPRRLKGAGALTFFFTFTMLFSGGLIPLYLLLKDLGFINTVWALTIPQAAPVFQIIITRTFFKTAVPESLHDAAEIDGATFAQTFALVVLPLSKAIIAVIALFQGVGQWNSFFAPLVFLTDQDKAPLQIVLRNLLLANQEISSSQDMTALSPEALEELGRRALRAEQMKYSLIVVASFPVLLVYPFLQKYFIKGVMLGSIKG